MIKLIVLVIYFAVLMALAYWMLAKDSKLYAALPLRERIKVSSWRVLAAAAWSLVIGGIILLALSKEIASLKYLLF